MLTKQVVCKSAFRLVLLVGLGGVVGLMLAAAEAVAGKPDRRDAAARIAPLPSPPPAAAKPAQAQPAHVQPNPSQSKPAAPQPQGRKDDSREARKSKPQPEIPTPAPAPAAEPPSERLQRSMQAMEAARQQQQREVREQQAPRPPSPPSSPVQAKPVAAAAPDHDRKPMQAAGRDERQPNKSDKGRDDRDNKPDKARSERDDKPARKEPADRDDKPSRDRADRDDKPTRDRADRDDRSDKARNERDDKSARKELADRDDKPLKDRADRDDRPSRDRADRDDKSNRDRADRDDKPNRDRADRDDRPNRDHADRDDRNRKDHADRDDRNRRDHADRDDRPNRDHSDRNDRDRRDGADRDDRSRRDHADRDDRSNRDHGDRNDRNRRDGADRDDRSRRDHADRDDRSNRDHGDRNDRDRRDGPDRDGRNRRDHADRNDRRNRHRDRDEKADDPAPVAAAAPSVPVSVPVVAPARSGPSVAPPITQAPPTPTVPVISVAEAVAATKVAESPQQQQQPEEMAGRMQLRGPLDTKKEKEREKDAEKDADGDKKSDDGGQRKGRIDSKSGAKANLADAAPILGSFRPREILAPHLPAALTKRLVDQRGYVQKDALTRDLTRLIVPDHVDVVKEVGKLRTEFDGQAFGLNFTYKSHNMAAETPARKLDAKPDDALRDKPAAAADRDAPPSVDLRGMTNAQCDSARCYGRSLIGWSDTVAACAAGVRVGIIDTGVDTTHPALGKLRSAVHPNADDPKKRSPNWHGTGVAALLVGASDSATPGLIPDAKVTLVDAFFKNDAGQAETDTDRLLWALEHLRSSPVKAQVVNMSLVGPADALLHEQIKAMAREGVVFVAAAGNGGVGAEAAYPAAYEEVIAVTAVDRERRNYANANHGSYIDVAAPGVRIWTALPANRAGMLSGTSFATPFVTAVAAAIYKSTGLDAARSHPRAGRDPKAMILARLSVRPIGSGSAVERKIFGQGLVQAPANCAPQPRGPQPTTPMVEVTPPTAAKRAVAAQQPPAPQETGWVAKVETLQRTSGQR